jgi:hypothetical protein
MSHLRTGKSRKPDIESFGNSSLAWRRRRTAVFPCLGISNNNKTRTCGAL